LNYSFNCALVYMFFFLRRQWIKLFLRPTHNLPVTQVGLKKGSVHIIIFHNKYFCLPTQLLGVAPSQGLTTSTSPTCSGFAGPGLSGNAHLGGRHEVSFNILPKSTNGTQSKRTPSSSFHILFVRAKQKSGRKRKVPVR
jgi:hypothetical protein